MKINKKSFKLGWIECIKNHEEVGEDLDIYDEEEIERIIRKLEK